MTIHLPMSADWDSVTILVARPRSLEPTAGFDDDLVPVLVEDETASIGTARQEVIGGETAITVDVPGAGGTDPVEVRFHTTGVLTMQEDRGPRSRWRLACRLRFPEGVEASVIAVDHPGGLKLRGRQDNAAYHTLAIGVRPERIRKLTYFRGPEAHPTWLFGMKEEDAYLRAVAGVPLKAGFGLFSLWLSIAIINQGLESIAAALMAFALLPPAFQFVGPDRKLYRSSKIRSQNALSAIPQLTMVVYLAALLFELLRLAFDEVWSTPATWVVLIPGGVLLALWAVLQVLIWAERLPECRCDGCLRVLTGRIGRELYEPTRQTLCRKPCLAGATAKAVKVTAGHDGAADRGERPDEGAGGDT